MEPAIPLSAVIDCAKLLPLSPRKWALWAADCAERTLHIYETTYPGDTRPRDAITAARSGHARAAADGAYAAHAAAYAARTAAYAAAYAARTAAYAAAHAARTAAYAAAHAARTAAYAAAHAAHAAAYAAADAAYAAAHAADADAAYAAAHAAECMWQAIRLMHYMSEGAQPDE